MISKFISQAVRALDPDGLTTISVADDDTDKILFLSNPKNIKPQQIIDKIPEVEAEYDAQEYARNRELEYPSTGDQLDMIYKDNKNSTTTHADAVEAVKTKWPKDNSGPK